MSRSEKAIMLAIALGFNAVFGWLIHEGTKLDHPTWYLIFTGILTAGCNLYFILDYRRLRK